MFFGVGLCSFLANLVIRCLKFLPYCAVIFGKIMFSCFSCFLVMCSRSFVASCMDTLSDRGAPCLAVVGQKKSLVKVYVLNFEVVQFYWF